MLKTLELQNFTVFKEATLNFSPGLNVIIGENGTGKSHLLKLGYAMMRVISFLCSISLGKKDLGLHLTIMSEISHIFSCHGNDILYSYISENHAKIRTSITDGSYINYNDRSNTFDYNVCKNEDFSFLFIPTKEILSIYKGFRSTLKNRELAFDGTYLELAEALDLPPFKGEKLEEVRPLYEPLERILHARVEQENGEFFFAGQGDGEKGGYKVHAQLAAEGHRKLGMLSYLIKNGSLRKGTSLFWDEPEANLNPRLLVKLAQVLVELSKIMQVTIATHSLFLLRELEILQEKQQLQNARYFGLHFADGGGVNVRQGDTSNDIGDIAALEANLEQSERYMNLSYGEE